MSTFDDYRKELREKIIFHTKRVEKIQADWPDYFNTPKDIYSDYCWSMDEIKHLKAELKSVLGVGK